MIILYTGTTGAGKTASVVARLLDGEFKGRKIYTNIRELSVPDYEIHPLPDVKLLPSQVAAGDLYIFDEVQKFYPQRGKEAAPDYISWFSEHRHDEVDFIMITQHPMLMDVFIRRLVKQHVHIVESAIVGAKPVAFTWTEYQEDVKDRQFASKSILNYKRAYPYYLSTKTGKHSKAITTKNYKPLLYIGIAVSIIAGSGYLLYHTYKASQERNKLTVNQEMAASKVQNKTGEFQQDKQSTFQPDYSEPLKPVIPQLPLTAASATLTSVGISACVSSKNSCICYGDAGTRLNPAINQVSCRDYAAHGLPPQLNPPKPQLMAINPSADSQPSTDKKKTPDAPVVSASVDFKQLPDGTFQNNQ